MQTFIYFARATSGEIKIGRSHNPEARIKNLNTANPSRIALLKVITGNNAMERELHKMFANERRHGEWFEPSKRLLEYVASLPGSTHFDYLSVLEPKLRDLLIEAQMIRDDKKKPYFCANRQFYQKGGLKVRISRLVGWNAEGQLIELSTSTAFDTVYKKIYSALPDCRNCQCVGT